MPREGGGAKVKLGWAVGTATSYNRETKKRKKTILTTFSGACLDIYTQRVRERERMETTALTLI